MRQILIIAHNTFRESVRDKVLYNLVIFVLMLIVASLYVGELSINQERKAMIDLGLSAMLLFGFMIAVFIGTGLVYKEIDKRTIYSILSKPICRYEFVVGKFLGLAITLFVNCSVMVTGLLLVLSYLRQGFDRQLLTILPTAFLIYLELLLMTAIALLFSSFSTPILSVFFTFLFYVIGNLNNDLKLFADRYGMFLNVQQYPQLIIGRTVLKVLYYALPNLSNFNFISRTAYGKSVPGATLALSVVYFLVYTTIVLSFTVLIFQRRNFK